MNEHPREITTVELSGEGKDALRRIVRDAGMVQQAALGRILTWFLAQDKLVQALVLGHVEDEGGDYVDFIMRRRTREAERNSLAAPDPQQAATELHGAAPRASEAQVCKQPKRRKRSGG